MSKKLKNPTVSVIVPNYNGKELLSENLPQVLEATKYKKNEIEEIIVVDDNSTDNSVKILKKEFPEVRLIKHKENRGFSSAVNTGARSAKGNLLCLLNSDVSPQKDFLEKSLDHFKKDENVFAVSMHEKGYGWAKGFFKDGFVEHEEGKESKKACETFWVNGGSGVFRRDYWMEVGGMDEVLFSPFYWEDVDLSYRAMKRGYRLLWEPGSKVVHEHESTIKKIDKKYRQRIQERNQLIFIWKNITSPILSRKHIKGLTRRIGRHPGYLKIVIMAMANFRKILKARRKEKKQAKISDEAIFAKFSR